MTIALMIPADAGVDSRAANGAILTLIEDRVHELRTSITDTAIGITRTVEALHAPHELSEHHIAELLRRLDSSIESLMIQRTSLQARLAAYATQRAAALTHEAVPTPTPQVP